jgi:hypothetical protein
MMITEMAEEHRQKALGMRVRRQLTLSRIISVSIARGAT